MLILQAGPFITAIVLAIIQAMADFSGAVVTRLALTRVAVGVLQEQAIGVAIAQSHFTITHATSVRTFVAGFGALNE